MTTHTPITREQPWHQRRVTHEHSQWLARLRALHAMNEVAWKLRDPKHAPRDLPFELDETRPEDVLARLEARVLQDCAEAWTALKSASPAAIEAAFREDGKRAAETAWSAPKPVPLAPELLSALAGSSPWSGYPSSRGFLTKRCIERQALASLLACPHQSVSDRVREEADRICRAHGAWAAGFVAALNPSARVRYERPVGASHCELAIEI